MKRNLTPKYFLLLLLLSALVLTAVGCSTAESAGTIITKTHEITESFTAISVECSECSISVLPSTGSGISVVCKEREKYPHKVTVKNGCLTIEEPNRTELINIFSLVGDHTEVLIYVPFEVAAGCSISLESASGDITLDKDFVFTRGDLETASGTVICNASFHGDLSIDDASGDVFLRGSTYGDIEIDAASGHIALEGLREAEEISLECASGNILLNTVQCKSLDAETASGKLTLEDVVAEKELAGETVSGAIILSRCDAEKYDLESASGDIQGSVLRPMHFITDSASGRINVPNTDGDPCRLTTASGNITITIEE